MPADRDDAACTVAGVRKPSMNETAGTKPFNERNRGKWQAMVPRALWGFSRGT